MAESENIMSKYRVDVFKNNTHTKKYFETEEETRTSVKHDELAFLLKLKFENTYDIVEQLGGKSESTQISFTALDLSNLSKWEMFHNNETLKTVLESLQRENSVENHILILQQLVGYLRCMMDMNAIEKNTYIILAEEIRFLKSEIKRIERGGK